MLPENLIETLKKQHYRIVGKHSGVQICRWTKKSLIDEGVCYKEKFYGIKSHLCCQMSPSIGFCQNRCLHCWRAIELTIGQEMDKTKIDDPKKIIQDLILAQRKLLIGFKGNKNINLRKYKEAQEPMQFAISLSGEPTLYPKIGELVSELRKLKKTSFIVTNGLLPEVLLEMSKNNQLPTQLYLSLNTPNQEMFEKWHRSFEKDCYQKFNKTLEIFPKLKTRKVIRMTLVKDLNMNDEYLKQYAALIKKAMPDFIEVKGYMAVGYARKRIGYDKMPEFKDISDYAGKLADELKSSGYKILDCHDHSRVVLLGKNKNKMKIKASEI